MFSGNNNCFLIRFFVLDLIAIPTQIQVDRTGDDLDTRTSQISNQSREIWYINEFKIYLQILLLEDHV